MSKNELVEFQENEIIEMLDDTSKIVANDKINNLSAAAVAAQESNALANNVEFWKWLNRNYSNSGIFESNATIQNYISQGAGKEEWLIKQLQGKGYEWDYMTSQRGNIKNIFKTYDAGDVANRAASDITEKNLLNGNIKEFQLKAYTSKTNPHLKNTPKDMTVVTNAEKVNVVKSNGYKDVESFQNAQEIKKSTNERLNQIKERKVSTSYSLKNVATTMAQAGLIGCVIGMGTEAISSYKAFKRGQITKEEYLKEVLKSGGDAGITATATSGIMIPISSAITVAGASTLLTIPIAFVIGGAVNKIVSPCFGHGDYKRILSEAKYYQNLDSVYYDLISSIQNSAEQYYDFVYHMSKQNEIYQNLKKQRLEMKQTFKQQDEQINQELKDLYDSI